MYENEKDIYIVMEVCNGGELFDRIQEKVWVVRILGKGGEGGAT